MNGTSHKNNDKPPPIPPRSSKPRHFSSFYTRHSESELQPYRINQTSQHYQTVNTPKHTSLGSGNKLSFKKDPLSSEVARQKSDWENHFVDRLLGNRTRNIQCCKDFVHTGGEASEEDDRTFYNLQRRRNATCFELNRTVRGRNEQKRLHLLFKQAMNE